MTRFNILKVRAAGRMPKLAMALGVLAIALLTGGGTMSTAHAQVLKPRFYMIEVSFDSVTFSNIDDGVGDSELEFYGMVSAGTNRNLQENFTACRGRSPGRWRRGGCSASSPRALGGHEADPLTYFHVIEEAARIDGSMGWMMLGNMAGVLLSYLDEETARQILAPDPDIIMSGTLIPSGRALPVEGGYRISGRWSFASGVENATWHACTCFVFDGVAPRSGSDGQPEMRVFLIPREALTVIDTWSVSGMRGTGSHNVDVADVFVPSAHTILLSDAPAQPGPLYTFPIRCLGAATIATVCLGLARGAIDALVSLAASKIPVGSRTLLAERTMVQVQVARAEAAWQAARSSVFGATEAMWEDVLAERMITVEQRAALRLAATHACEAAAQVTGEISTAAGTTALYTSSPLERALRDVQAAVRHFSVQPATYEPLGRILLGLSVDPSFPL